MLKFITRKILGSQNDRELRHLSPVVEEINSLEPKIQQLSDAQIRARMGEFRNILSDKSKALKEDFLSLEEQIREATSNTEKAKLKSRLKGLRNSIFEEILPEAFACVREAAKRAVNMRHFDVQLIGGIVLHEGKIAEMSTREGKTPAATLPAYLNALLGEGVHIITVNDYLARRDAVLMGQVYNFLGLSVGVIN